MYEVSTGGTSAYTNDDDRDNGDNNNSSGSINVAESYIMSSVHERRHG